MDTEDRSVAPTVKPRKNLRDVDRAFIHAVMFELGILPMESTTLDMERALKQLSPDEQRQLKRKFRKMWRKAMKKEVGSPKGKRADAKELLAKTRLGVGKKTPSRQELNARKQLVFDQVWNAYIAPLIANFESAGEKFGKRAKPTAQAPNT
jgi:hypothetical protein